MRNSSHFCLLSIAVALTAQPAGAISVLIDYTYDTGNFFSAGSAERDRLEEAADYFGDLLVDDLEEIDPPGHWFQFDGEAWQATFVNPSDVGTPGNENIVSISDLVVPADTIIIYAGSDDLGLDRLAEAGFGGANLFTTEGSVFDTTIKTRGESGAGTTDFGPWGGFVSINHTATWDATTDASGTGQHLYSTLIHEVAHVLGFGTAPSWDAQIVDGHFTGPKSVAENGGDVDINGGDHWAPDTESTIRGTSTSQEASLDPTILQGTIKEFTDLDVAGLDDIGWDIAPIPEPSQTLLLVTASLAFLRRRR